MIFGRIVCFFNGHKRGKFLHQSAGPLNEGGLVQGGPVRIYACPRCGRQTRYKVKFENHGAPGDEA